MYVKRRQGQRACGFPVATLTPDFPFNLRFLISKSKMQDSCDFEIPDFLLPDFRISRKLTESRMFRRAVSTPEAFISVVSCNNWEPRTYFN